MCYDDSMKATLLFDASALITTARFEIMGTPILDHIIACCQLVVPQTVKVEVVDAGLQGGYADAALLDARIGSGAILVMATQPQPGAFQTVLDDYGIEAGDKDLLWLCRQTQGYEFAIVDDRLLYIVLSRFQMRPRFLPDLVVWLVQQGHWTVDLAHAALNVSRPRYRAGFVTHSLEQLKGSL
jgi:hypothetical protein